jgi:hypothetical protein
MREILEHLNEYAAEPPADRPPEILPWDHADPWGLDGAARAALGLILDGEKPGDRLFEVADYLLTFCVEGYGTPRFPDALLLNGTALALCGYLCEGAHPEAELWRVTGCARLATEVHRRKAARENRMAADCLSAVCRVADELELPILADLVTLRERIWGRLMDHSRVERLNVSEEEYPNHLKEPIPAERVGEVMANREWQRKARSPEYLMRADLEDAEGTCRNLITLRAHMLVRHQFGDEIDWNLRLFDDIESTVSLCGHGFIRNLAAAYLETGDEKYARHAARLLWSFYRLCPLPNHRQYQGPWRTLEVGNRQCNIWPDVIGYLGATEAFDAETHAMLARSRLEHMRYLLAYCGPTNNWYQVESAGLATAALFSPELRHAEAYLRVALRRLKWINSFAYYDDGFQFELSHLYHVFPTSSMFAVIRTARARDVNLPEEFVSLIEKAHEMYLYAMQPDRLLPTFNDNNPQPLNPSPLLRAAGELFGREDLLWAGTDGREGRSPDHASHAWPSAGYYVMRDKWDEDGDYLYFDGAPWGASHQHEDKLSFVLYSRGRLMIGDPNIYSYARTELTHYFRSSRGHNVVLVDGRGQARRYRPEARLSTLGRNEWVSREEFDFVSSEYKEGFALDPYDKRGMEIKADHTITHRRAIFYIKSEYWVLCDLIRGEDKELHTLEQIFHIAPIYDPDAPEPMRAGKVSVSPSEIVTRDEGLANLAILPVDPEGLEVRAQKGETSPAVGWYGVLGEFPAWDVTLQHKKRFPARLDVVLFPMAPGEESRPRVYRLRADEKVTAFRIVGEGLDDTFVLCEEGAGSVTVGDLTFEGRALLLRRKPEIHALTVKPIKLILPG